MKRIYGVIISLIMLMPLFAKSVSLEVKEFESGFEISNLDAKGKRICKGFLSFIAKEDVYIILKENKTEFSSEKFADKIVHYPHSTRVFNCNGESFINVEKNEKLVYGPISNFDSILVVATNGKLMGVDATYDGKNIKINISGVDQNLDTSFSLLVKKYTLEKKAEEEKKKTEVERLVAEQKWNNDKREQEIRRNIEVILNKRDVYKNDLFAYLLTQDGTLGIVAYLGDSKDVLEIPEEIEGIPVDRILYLKSLKKVHFKTVMIPKKIKLISDHAFYNLGIEKIIFEEGSELQKVGDEAFRFNNLTEMNLPRKDLVIGYDAFSDNLIKKVSVYKDWSFYMKAGFYGKFIGADSCFNQEECAIIKSEVLEEVVFEEGRENIPPKAFAGCNNLRKISIPSTMSEFGTCAFQNCTALSEIVIAGSPVTSIKDSVGNYKAGSDLRDAALLAPGSMEKLFAEHDARSDPYSGLYFFYKCNLDLKTKKMLIDMGFPTDAF